jgi:hypothetical protein
MGVSRPTSLTRAAKIDSFIAFTVFNAKQMEGTGWYLTSGRYSSVRATGGFEELGCDNPRR